LFELVDVFASLLSYRIIGITAGDLRFSARANRTYVFHDDIATGNGDMIY